MIKPWVGKAPHTAYLYPTLLCNLTCEMCYSGSHHDGKAARNDELSLDEYANLIPHLYEIGVRTFDISGGEPFLRKDIWDIFRLIKAYPDTTLLVVSNGTRWRKILPQLERHIDLIDRMYISIDSPVPEEHNRIRGHHRAFQDAVAGIIAAQAIGFDRLGCNMVVMTQNKKRVQDFLSFAVVHRLRYVNLLRLLDVVRDRDQDVARENLDAGGMDAAYLDAFAWLEHHARSEPVAPLAIRMVLPGCFLDAYLQAPRRRSWPAGLSFDVEFDPIRGCPAYGDSIIVSSKGEITGCTAFVTQTPFHSGNVRSIALDEAIAGWSERRALLRQREEYLRQHAPCAGCEYWHACRGGCPATAYRYFGTIMRADPTCRKALESGRVPPAPVTRIQLELPTRP
jgi:radical SAM protein with 4Fe4S-binding SPASM domain